MRKRFRSPSRGIWILVILLLVACLAGVGLLVKNAGDDSTEFGLWAQTYLDNPVPAAITVPPQHLPVPNAFDNLVEAGKAMVNPEQIKKPPTDLAAKRTLLKKNARALALLRNGFPQQFSTPRDLNREKSEYLFRRAVWLTRLIRMESEIKRADGDQFGAVNCTLDNVQFGGQLSYAGQGDISAAGVITQRTALKAAWDDLDHLNAQQAGKVGKRLDLIFSRQASAEDRLQEALWAYMTITQRLVAEHVAQDPSDSGKQTEEYFLRKMHLYHNYYQQAIANARLPYPQQQSLPLPPSGIRDFINDVESQNIREISFTLAHLLAKERLLRVALALRAYHLEHQSYPDSLDSLVPAYLTRLPADPFTLTPLHYQRTGKTYLLYSAGPDGQDDGGAAIDNLDRQKDRYFVSTESRGDIVAGLNR